MTDSRAKAGNVVGVDPHRRTLTAAVLDERGGALDTAHFPSDAAGFADLLRWAQGYGPVFRWGVEGACGLGRHLSAFLVEAGGDVRDVPPHRSTRRHRHQGKSDALDAQQVAAETQTNPSLPRAFKQAESLPADAAREQLALWHNARRSLVKMRIQLQGEIDALLQDLPEPLRSRLPAAKSIRARIRALHELVDTDLSDSVHRLRLELLRQRVRLLGDIVAQEKQAAAQLDRLVAAADSTLTDLVGIAPRTAAELLVEVGDVRRFSEAGFARFNGTAPLPATSGEGAGRPVRHRLNRGGNRRINALLYRLAMTQLRCDDRARHLYGAARQRGYTGREAMRILKRHLSNVVYRAMLADTRTPALT